jgi:hypothetical protein
MQIELLNYLKTIRPLNPLPPNYKENILTPLLNLANGPFLEVNELEFR